MLLLKVYKHLKEKAAESFISSLKVMSLWPYVGESTFLVSDICFLQILMVDVTLKDRESQNVFPLILTSKTSRSLTNFLTKLASASASQ